MTDEKIVPLGVQPPAAPPPSPPGRLHGYSITGMAIFALIGIVTMLVLTTVQWSDPTRRYIIAILVLSIIGFITFAAAAVLTAARDTYARSATGGDAPRS